MENIVEPFFKFLYIDGDTICPYDKQDKYAKKIPAYFSEATIYGRVHSFVVGDNDEEFV